MKPDRASGYAPALSRLDVDLTIDEAQRATLERGARRMRAMIAARVRRGDFLGALALYGHADRLPAVLRWRSAGRGPLRQALADAWTSTEFRPDAQGGFDSIFCRYGTSEFLPLWRNLAAGERIEDGEPLPAGDPVTVFRGQGDDGPSRGISWTLDRPRAEWFATTVPRVGTRDGLVLTGQVARDAILGYLTARHETEVIADPADVVIVASHELKASGETVRS